MGGKEEKVPFRRLVPRMGFEPIVFRLGGGRTIHCASKALAPLLSTPAAPEALSSLQERRMVPRAAGVVLNDVVVVAVCRLGKFSRTRPGARFRHGCRVGCFVSFAGFAPASAGVVVGERCPVEPSLGRTRWEPAGM